MLAIAISAALATLTLTLAPAPARAADADQNGIDDDDELALARRFCPALQLHAPETTANGVTTPVYPVPVSIMGLAAAQPGGDSGLTADRLFVVWRQQPLDYPYGDHWVGATGWTPPLPENDPAHNYAALTDEPPDYRNPIAPPAMPSGPYTLRFHWEYGNPAVNEPAEWYDVWQHGNAWTRPGADFTPTVYAHLFRCDVAGCDLGAPVGPTAVVIQYWFLLPFNDWINNHEGDWEGVNVLLSSADPASAAITEVETFAHKVYIARDPTYYPALADHVLLTGGTHPVVFLGGHGYLQGCIGGAGSGEGSHGCYPTCGRWREVGGGDPIGCFDPADEIVAHAAGPYVDWRDFDVQVLPDPGAPGRDYDAHPETAWLAADLLWGTRRVPSVGGDLVSDAGNWAPHGPVYNTEQRWNHTARGSTCRLYVEPGLPHPRPFASAPATGWQPFALFLDAFTGDSEDENALQPGWIFGTGDWQLAGGELAGRGDGTRALANRAAFVFEREPAWYALPFAARNPRLTRLACDIRVAEVPDSTQIGVAVQGGTSSQSQVRVVWWRVGTTFELRVISTTDGGATWQVHAAGPVFALGALPRRLEVVTLDRSEAPVAFHDVRVDSVLLLESVATPALGDDARALVADGAAQALFDRVAVSYARMGDAYRYPPFAAWTAAPAAGDTVRADPWALAWEAADEKWSDGIASQRLELTTDGGATWTTVAALDGGARGYTWQPLPPPAPVSARLRLVVDDLEGDSRTVSSDAFILAPAVTGVRDGGDGNLAVRDFDLAVLGHGGAGDGTSAGIDLEIRLGRRSIVRLRVIGVTGRHLRRLVRGAELPAGTHRVRWDLRDEHGHRVPSGIYLVLLDVNGRRAVAKVQVVR